MRRSGEPGRFVPPHGPTLAKLVTLVALSGLIAAAGVASSPFDAGAVGATLRCDFDGDGFADHALGVPRDDVDGLSDAGSIHVLYGTGAGLSASGDQVWARGPGGLNHDPRSGDELGSALACGDFDGDGYDDLAIGVPGDDLAGVNDAGSVQVVYGSSSGLTGVGNEVWHRERAGINDDAASGDRFGFAVATGDFDGDDFDDLLVGVPGDVIGGHADAGSTHVLYGSVDGVTSADDQIWHLDRGGIFNVPQPGDRFGLAVAAGDFDGDGFDDAAFGVPFEGGGQVHVLYGTTVGLARFDAQIWAQRSQTDDGLNGSPQSGERLGSALATGDFDGDGFDDLAVGVPREDLGVGEAGAVHVVYGAAAGLTELGDQVWHRDRGGINHEASSGDRFGSAVATGDFDGDGFDDLLVGVPRDDVAGVVDAGSAHVLYGSVDGVARFDDQVWHRDRGGINHEASSGDRFGFAVATGDFDGDGLDDVVVGVPRDDVMGVVDAGSAHVLYGSVDGVARFDDQVWHRDRGGVEDALQPGDWFGSASAGG